MQEFDSAKYYNAETQKKVLFIPNLSNLLNYINLQTLKLPHEIMQDGSNQGTGTTYADIEKSIINGVKILYANLQPLRVQTATEYPYPKPTTFDEACDMLGWMYSLLDSAGYLNDKIVEDNLPDDQDYGVETIAEADD